MKRKALFRFLPVKFAALLAPLIAAWPLQRVQAATLNWNGADPTNNWSAPLNWGGAAPAAGDILNFLGTTNVFTNNDLAGLTPHQLVFGPGAANFTLGGNAVTLIGNTGVDPLVANNSLNSTATVGLATIFDGALGTGFGQIQANSGNLVFSSTVGVAGGTMLNLSTGAGRTAIFNGAITGGAGGLNMAGSGVTALNAANTFAAGAQFNVTGGRVEVLSAGGLGTGAAAANSTVNVLNGAQVDFNGIALTGNGKNFIIEGAGPDGRGALINNYAAVDAQKAIFSLTLTDNATIGGTNTMDIGSGAAGQFLDGGGNTLTLATRNRLNIRAAVSNLPQIIVNSGNVETEGVDVPAATSVTLNGFKTDLGAWLGGTSTIRTWAGDITLNNGANIGGIGTGGAANTLVIGSAGRTLTINGEGRLNQNTTGFIDWSGISGAGNMRVESTIAGSGRLVTGYFGTGTNGTTVTLAQDNPGFTGQLVVGSGTLQVGNGGATGDLGAGTSVVMLSNSTPLISINRTSPLTLNQNFSGSGSINIDNLAADVTLNGTNTLGGPGASAFALRVRGGTLTLGSASALSPRQTLEIGGLGVATGSLTRLNGFSPVVERLDDGTTNTAGVFNRIVNGSATPATLTFNINNAGPVFGDFGGNLGGPGASEDNFGITKIGSNDFGLAGSGHSYTGLTTINGGTIRLNNNATYGIGRLGASTGTADGTVVNPGGSLDFGGLSAGDERISIAGRGHSLTAHGFEMGALRNNPGTAATSGNSAKFVSLAGNASIGKAGNGVDVNHWEIANAGGTAQLNLNGNTLRKVGNNVVKVSDVTGGTGDGSMVVRQGMLSLERGTALGAGTRLSVNSRSYLNLNDNGAAITLNGLPVSLNSGSLINQGGSHTVNGIASGGSFSAENIAAGTTLNIGSITGPARGMGGFIGTTGDVVVSGFAPGQRLGPGFTAGASSYTYPGGGFSTLTTPATAGPAEWDGTKVIAAPLFPMAAGVDVGNAAATTVPAGGLDIRTLSTSADVIINNGDLLRITDGTVFQRGGNQWIQTNAGTAIGRLSSGRADGELHFNLPEALDTAGRNDMAVRVQVTDNPVTAGPKAGTFVPNLVAFNGNGSATNFGGSAFAGAGNNTQNNFTAGAIINGGRVSLQFGSAFGHGPLTVRDGGQIATFNLTAANGSHISNALDLAGAGVLENAGALGAIRLGNAVTLSGNTMLSAETRLHAHGAGDVGTLAGVARGAGGVDKTGDGFLVLNAPNTYTGATTITRGTLVTNRIATAGSPSGLGASSGAAANLVLNGGTLRYDGPGATLDRDFTLDIQGGAINNNYHTGSLTVAPGAIAVSDGGDRTLSLVSAHRTANVFDGVLSDPNAGRGSLNVTGLGTWQILRDQTLSGNVTVGVAATNQAGGAIIVGNGGTSGSLGNGVSIALANANDIFFNRSDTVTLAHGIGSAANSEIVQIGSGTLAFTGTVDNATNNIRVENGTIELAKTSTINIHAAAGNVFVNNGTLRLAGTGNDQIVNSAAMFINGGTFDLNGRYESVARVEGLGGTITNLAAGTTSELRLGGAGSNGASAFTGTFIPGVIGATGTGGYGGVIRDGAGAVMISKDGNALIALHGNNTYSGGTEILQGTLQVGRNGSSSGSLGSGDVLLGAGDFGTNGANVGTLRVDRSGTLTMNQVISGPGNVDKRGSGELVLTGQNTWQGVTVVRNGTLTADLSANDNVLPVNAGYSLEGGTLKILGRAGGSAVQDFLPTNIAMTNVGGSGAGAATATFNIQGGILLADNNGGSLTVNLPGTLTRATGGSVDFATAGAGTSTYRSAVQNAPAGIGAGIIGTATAAPATFNGSSWAMQTGQGTIGALPAGSYNIPATGHLDVPAGPTGPVLGVIGATARFDQPGAATVTLAGATSLSQGGVLVTSNVGANDVTITGAFDISGGGNELFFHQHNTRGNLVIQSNINGTNAITKAGAGSVVLTGTNGSTGGTFINQGTLQVGAGGAGGTTGTLPTGAIVNDGSLVIARTNGTFASPYLLATGNVISGSGSVRVEGGSGWVDFNKVNQTYTGATTISSGYVQNLINNSGQLAPVTLGDANTGSQPIALVSNHTASTSYNFPIIVPDSASGGTGPVYIGSSGGTGAVPALYNGTLDLNRATTLIGNHPDRTTFTNSIAGNVGTLTISVADGAGNPLLPGTTLVASTVGARRITMEGTNSFVGDVEIRSGSALQLGTGTVGVFRDQIPDASNVSLFETNSTLQFNYEGEVINNLNGEIGTVVRSIATGGAHMVLGVNGGTFDGTFDGGSNGGMYIEKNGAGTLSLGGTADNPGGKVRVNSGTLNLNKASSGTVHAVATDLTINGGTVVHTGAGDDQIWNGTVVTMNGGTMDLNGKSDTISGLQGLGGTITNNAAATISTLGIGDTSNVSSSVFYGSINDGAGVVKVTKNTAVAHGLVLAGDNTYSGGTTLDAGVLQLGNGGTAGNAGTGPITTAANTRVIVDRSNAVTLPNDISGGASLTNQGGGTLTLTGTNTHTGLNVINNGATTVIGSGGTSGSIGTGNISNFGELRFNRSDTMTLSQSIADLQADTGLVRQAGTGKTILTGNSMYYGSTLVDAGTLQIDGNVWSGPVTVAAAGNLGGTGVITTSSVTISGDLSPGASPGVLDISGPITFAGSAAYNVEFGGNNPGDGAGFYDQTHMTSAAGSVDLGSTTALSLSLFGGFTPSYGDIYYIMSRADAAAFTTQFAGLPEGATINLAGLDLTLTYQANWTGTQAGSTFTGGNDIALFVPEPGSAALAAAASLLLFNRRRRRTV